MNDEKTEVKCHLVTRGTNHANAQAVDDLSVPDPEPTIGERIIKLQLELQLLELRLRTDDYDSVTQEGPVLSMSEARKIALEIKAKRAIILDLRTRR